VLFGSCAGGALCAHFAADRRDRTAGLVLFGAFARLLRTDDYPWGWPSGLYQRFLGSFEEAWLDAGDRQARRNPSLVSNPRYRDWFARYTRLAANPFMARRLAEMNAEIDIRDLLPRIRTPCLVIVRAEDVWMSADNSRYLAEHIAGARLVVLPGVDHDPWAGDTGPLLEEVRAFLRSVYRDAGLVAEKR
jgi:pimeloyl-ACP methyl ester carboxylesterase